jgi:uncharacterized protein YeaO (DUF488 family)
MIRVKDAFAKPKSEDGERILVELFWPPELMTYYAKVDRWLKELGPSYDLQRFYFDKGSWSEYMRRYKEELQHPDKQALLAEIADKARNGSVTLLYGNRDPRYNNALVVKEVVEEHYLRRPQTREPKLAQKSDQGG